MTAGETAPICATCLDAHTMRLGDRLVPCTHCPVPCQACRSHGGTGAYCQTKPCACACHLKLEGPYPAPLYGAGTNPGDAPARGRRLPLTPDDQIPLLPGCRTMSATLRDDRNLLGNVVTAFLTRLRAGGGRLTQAPEVRQSSDSGFHCLSIILFYEAPAAFVTA